MARMARWNLILAVGLLCAVGAYAVPPAYIGPMGNLEEPALRPYKWILRGMKALAFQTVDAIDRGNRKTPGLGTAEGFRGIRKGAVEMGESCCKGLQFSAPPSAGDYKKTGAANGVIENDLLLRNVADYVVASQLLVWADGDDAWRWGALLWAAQKANDHHPAVNAVDQERMAEKVQQIRAARANAGAAKKTMTRREAQAAYIEDRIPQQRKDPYKGNILKLAR